MNQYVENEKLDNIDVSYKTPENAFSNIKHYKAMKQVEEKQKQALYLLTVEEYSLKKVAKILNTTTKDVIRLKKKAIKSFKKNLKKLE